LGDWLYYNSSHTQPRSRGISRYNGSRFEPLYREEYFDVRGSSFHVVEFASLNDELYVSFSGSDAFGRGIWKLTETPCNYNGDSFCDVADIDVLSAAVRAAAFDAALDLDQDGQLSASDRRVWVEDYLQTFFGDANLDGQFNSVDLVAVFEVGEYRDAMVGNSTWAEGDWNGDGDFDDQDLVGVFTTGGYEQGVRPRPSPVPEPSAGLALGIGWGLLTILQSRRRITPQVTQTRSATAC
jgi:hypothetical protein